MVQASAGTGKSFLLTTLFLWALVKNKKMTACAPTGIAAANIEIAGTGVSASTIHNVYELDGELQTKLDFNKRDNKHVADLLATFALLIDEVSMIDTELWNTLEQIMTLAQAARRPGKPSTDAFGEVRLLLFLV